MFQKGRKAPIRGGLFHFSRKFGVVWRLPFLYLDD